MFCRVFALDINSLVGSLNQSVEFVKLEELDFMNETTPVRNMLYEITMSEVCSLPPKVNAKFKQFFSFHIKIFNSGAEKKDWKTLAMGN